MTDWLENAGKRFGDTFQTAGEILEEAVRFDAHLERWQDSLTEADADEIAVISEAVARLQDRLTALNTEMSVAQAKNKETQAGAEALHSKITDGTTLFGNAEMRDLMVANDPDGLFSYLTKAEPGIRAKAISQMTEAERRQWIEALEAADDAT